MISAATHIARLVRAAYVFAREGVFGVVDPSLVPPPGQLALRLARLIERPGAKSGPRLSRALTRLGPAYLKLGLNLGYWGIGPHGEEAADLVKAAEAAGFDSVWAAESYGSDVVSVESR